MALTTEDLLAISNLIQSQLEPLKKELTDMVKSQMEPLKEELTDMVISQMEPLKNEIIKLRLHLENTTDKNVQLLAENHIELTKKLNQAISVADNNLAFEVKMSYLHEKVNRLEQEVADLKSKIA